jgi:electron transfer flavoprotein beta subunit
MRILVYVHQALDPESIFINPVTGALDRARTIAVLPEADTAAVEAALQIGAALGGDVLALACGPQEDEAALRHCLAMGAAQAIRVWEPGMETWGAVARGQALAPLVPAFAPDAILLLYGAAPDDYQHAGTSPALATALGWPHLADAAALAIRGDGAEWRSTNWPDQTAGLDAPPIGAREARIVCRRARGARELLAAALPAVCGITAIITEPRYPALPALIAAGRQEITCRSPAVPWPLKARAHTEVVMEAGRSDPSSTDARNTAVELITVMPPRPRPHYVPAPDPHLSAFDRIGTIVSGGLHQKQGRIVEGSPEALARALIAFLREQRLV